MNLLLVAPVGRWLERWAVTSQQQARRNAMVAATALTQRRTEVREVQDFLAARGTWGTAAAGPAPAALPRRGRGA